MLSEFITFLQTELLTIVSLLIYTNVRAAEIYYTEQVIDIRLADFNNIRI